MAPLRACETIDHHRRNFFGAAAMTVAAAGFDMSSPASAQAGAPNTGGRSMNQAGTHTSFPSIKQIDAGVLNAGYAEAGRADGRPVILLHGWPYDIHTYVDVAPLLLWKHALSFK
jgi:hypothetical protein